MTSAVQSAPRWLRRTLCVLAGFVALYSIKGAYVAGLHVGERMHTDAAAPVQVDLAAWREAFAADKRALSEASGATEWAAERFARRLGEMQAEILRLEAQASQIVERIEGEAARPWEGAYGLASPPALGGPEDMLAGDEDPTRLLLAAGRDLSATLADRRRQLTVFAELVKLRRLDNRTRPEGWPVRDAYISSQFGERIDPFSGRRAAHRGIDFAARPGTEVMAVASGLVIWSGYRGGYGNTVDIDHGNGYITRYAHNAENLVDAGDVVSRGDVISLVGSTGRATGPHVHFEVLQQGRAISPRRYIED